MLLNAHIIEIDTLQPFIFFSSHENLKKNHCRDNSCFMEGCSSCSMEHRDQLEEKGEENLVTLVREEILHQNTAHKKSAYY